MERFIVGTTWKGFRRATPAQGPRGKVPDVERLESDPAGPRGKVSCRAPKGPRGKVSGRSPADLRPFHVGPLREISFPRVPIRPPWKGLQPRHSHRHPSLINPNLRTNKQARIFQNNTCTSISALILARIFLHTRSYEPFRALTTEVSAHQDCNRGASNVGWAEVSVNMLARGL